MPIMPLPVFLPKSKRSSLRMIVVDGVALVSVYCGLDRSPDVTHWKFVRLLDTSCPLWQIMGVLPVLVQVALATPALKNKASELATIGVKNLLELLRDFAERLFRELFCAPPPAVY